MSMLEGQKIFYDICSAININLFCHVGEYLRSYILHVQAEPRIKVRFPAVFIG